MLVDAYKLKEYLVSILQQILIQDDFKFRFTVFTEPPTLGDENKISLFHYIRSYEKIHLGPIIDILSKVFFNSQKVYRHSYFLDSVSSILEEQEGHIGFTYIYEGGTKSKPDFKIILNRESQFKNSGEVFYLYKILLQIEGDSVKVIDEDEKGIKTVYG